MAVRQGRRQLLAPNWGIITNGTHIQLFRKHSKVVFPATVCLELTTENVDKVVSLIKDKMDNTPRALTVVVYQ
ncbi:MAG: hypothetical protein RMK91_03010 [Pseudanabaenaceae cyanobacterium SKYGB_i_bin29]|nr:hypothetical protein [Pseudanabaenaceae cyanobacterium SKYG29]MDW8420813.1 hypothetical protein [Pseudanabaenaceae cyanobacterium SKYGB_i_bin29]